MTRFRQGLGRLIRHEDDKGLIVSFDDRLVNSNFKNFFAQTLENYRQKRNIKQFNKLVGQIQKSMKRKNKFEFLLRQTFSAKDTKSQHVEVKQRFC